MNTIFLRIEAGDSDEARLWAWDLARMYVRWSERTHTVCQEIDADRTESGARRIVLRLSGPSARDLLDEAGIHVVTRVSPLDSQKRRHTDQAIVRTYAWAPTLPAETMDVEQVHGGTLPYAEATHRLSRQSVRASRVKPAMQRETALELLAAVVAGHAAPADRPRRTYRLDPYTEVRDYVSGMQTEDVKSVLNGELERMKAPSPRPTASIRSAE